MTRPVRWLLQQVVRAQLIVAAAGVVCAQEIQVGDPAELVRHPEWVGKEVIVDARVLNFRAEEGRRYKELILRRSGDSVVFRLPPPLRPETSETLSIHAVEVRGILHQEERAWFCDVTRLTVVPRDLDRLQQASVRLGPDDFERKMAWVRWALDRARWYQDEKLAERARTIEASAIAVEAERIDGPDAPAKWLRLAQLERQHKVPEPDPSALAHRAFRARLAASHAAGDLEKLVQEIKEFWPGAAKAASALGLESLVGPYAHDPAGAYRRASAPLRLALDRRLLADALQKWIERQAADQPNEAAKLAAMAREQLPDRPEVAKQFEEESLEAAVKNSGALRRDQMEQLASEFERNGQPERASNLKRNWLEEQAKRLSDSDAEGRVVLARQYSELLDDRAGAKLLLLEALRIDANYRGAEDAMRELGFRKVNDEWVDSRNRSKSAAKDSDSGAQGAAAGGNASGDDLRGLTRAQVRVRMGGRPDLIVRTASQGEVVEQWIYRLVKDTYYVNFVRRSSTTQPVCEAHYRVPNR
jgi:hypothetical protein